jgi:leucyl aminopeptidase (aminopeptidase T)
MHVRKGVAFTVSLVSMTFIASARTPAQATASSNLQSPSTSSGTRGASVSPATPATPFISTFEPAMAYLVRATKLGPGQTAVIWGTASMLPLMERLAIASERAGAAARISVTTDSLERARFGASVEQRRNWVRGQIAERQAGDIVVFNFPGVESWALGGMMTADERRVAQSADSLYGTAMKEKGWRDIAVNIPIGSDTVNTTLTMDRVAQLRAAAMMADGDAMAAIGRTLRDRLVAAKKIRLTSPDGTDITFTLRPGHTTVNAGVATSTDSPMSGQFPGGAVEALIDTASGSGVIRVPWDACNVPLVNESITVAKGRAVAITAGNDEACVQKAVAPLSLGLMTIGLNPASDAATSGARVPVNDFYGAGLVALGFGGYQWLVPVPHATVLADDVVVVRDGRLVAATAAGRR